MVFPFLVDFCYFSRLKKYLFFNSIQNFYFLICFSYLRWFQKCSSSQLCYLKNLKRYARIYFKGHYESWNLFSFILFSNFNPTPESLTIENIVFLVFLFLSGHYRKWLLTLVVNNIEVYIVIVHPSVVLFELFCDMQVYFKTRARISSLVKTSSMKYAQPSPAEVEARTAFIRTDVAVTIHITIRRAKMSHGGQQD